MSINEKYDYLINSAFGNEIIEEVVNAITSIYGLNDTSIDNIVYYYSGYNTLKQYLECEDYNTYCEYYNEDED